MATNDDDRISDERLAKIASAIELHASACEVEDAQHVDQVPADVMADAAECLHELQRLRAASRAPRTPLREALEQVRQLLSDEEPHDAWHAANDALAAPSPERAEVEKMLEELVQVWGREWAENDGDRRGLYHIIDEQITAILDAFDRRTALPAGREYIEGEIKSIRDLARMEGYASSGHERRVHKDNGDAVMKMLLTKLCRED